MGKHRELAKELYSSRIWRTVVFAGAMLGTPAVAVADQPAQGAPAPQAIQPPMKPMPKPDPLTQKTQALETANTERTAILVKLTSVEIKEIDKVKKELDAKDAQIKKLVTEIVNLRKPRPRTPPDVRPVGRGFVLA